jgi:hypothetical protein
LKNMHKRILESYYEDLQTTRKWKHHFTGAVAVETAYYRTLTVS